MLDVAPVVHSVTRVLRPRSILQLVLIGFGIVTLPLIVAFIATALFVSDLSRTGQQAIVRAADVIQESRLLVEGAAAMERIGNQYLVLDDPTVLQVYLRHRSDLRQAATALRKLALTDVQRSLLSELERHEADLHRRLTDHHPKQTVTAVDAGEFTQLTSLARGVLGESGQLITTNIQALNDNADRVHRLLLWESIALVPMALLLAGAFVVLINRQLRNLNAAIYKLGAGQFDEKVVVRGPRDLQELGEQLEWTRKRLKELENQKALFLRNVSHELKTPLTTLREGTQLLAEQVVGTLNHEQREIVNLLSENSLQLQRMIEDLLHFSFSQAAPLHVESRPVALDRLVEQVLAEQRLIVQAKRLSVKSEVATMSVRGDRMKLKAVLGNLVSNAIKFSPPNSPLCVKLSKHGPWAEFEVIDNGPGITVDDRRRIFEAFYQGTARYEGHVKGTGLGLFIAQEFVRLHKGTIDVLDSTQGTHLRVRLPLAVGDPLGCDDAVRHGDTGHDGGVDRRLCDPAEGAADCSVTTSIRSGSQ